MSIIQTSTPIIFPKPSSQSSRKSWLNQDITQQLYRNTWAKFKSPNKSAHWDSIEGPKFVDFNDEPADPRDSFFDGKQPDCPSPQRKQDMTLPSADEPMEIVQCLKACSISSIEISSSDHEDTLLGDDCVKGDDTLRPPESSPEISKSDRRQSQLIVKPFSFELREKENQERRESRRAYYKMLTEKMTPQSFKAKPVPKFIQRASLTGKSELNTETPHCRVVRVPRRETAESNPSKVLQRSDKPKSLMQILKSMETSPNSFQIQQKAKSVVNSVQAQSIKTGQTNPFQIQQKSKSVGNPVQLQKIKNSASIAQSAKDQKPSGSLNTDGQQGNKSVVNVFQNKKPRPFQVVLPHRKIEIPKSPELLTARRARERQAFEEKMKGRELQREEMKKKAEAAQKAKEQEEIARLRKMTVFKARPVPQYVKQVAKRPLTDPMIPIFTKRRRCL